MSHPITDHALIRYLERVKGIDVETIRNSIADDRTIKQITALKNTKKFHIRKKDCVLRVVGGKVVTVLDRRKK